ncbi:unnamed protein product [Nippostrongylus brasiliensis]|uniref:Uncharacterized protein n=1 Tax=Nippostrongylus brasiliensis TaxID=27835 RepID=A0A0N4XCA6_NIPBR|nr:unnamed protein product [Nippostrongylus brasiliensis]
MVSRGQFCSRRLSSTADQHPSTRQGVLDRHWNGTNELRAVANCGKSSRCGAAKHVKRNYSNYSGENQPECGESKVTSAL